MNHGDSPVTKTLQNSKIMLWNYTHPAPHQEQGQSLVEMALSLVFILILLCGVVDIGRLFYHYIALRDAAAEGATYASVCPPWEPENTLQVMNRIRTSSTFPVDLRRPEVFIAVTYANPPVRGSQIYVQVTETEFNFITPLMTGFNPYPLTATVQEMAGVDECQVKP